MNMTLERGRTSLLTIALVLLSLVLVVAGFAFSVRSSAAQTADTDADSYADDLERQLGSNPNDPESTPENFALLWTCTDGNDNDRDGKRDFIDPGCRNTVPGSTPAPTTTPAPGGSSDSGTNPGGNGSGSGGGSGSKNTSLSNRPPRRGNRISARCLLCSAFGPRSNAKSRYAVKLPNFLNPGFA